MTDGARVVRYTAVTGAADPSLLTDAERSRAAALRTPALRAAFVAAHVLVRECAGELAGLDPGQLVVVQRCPHCDRPHGRPQIRDRPDLHVSLSHTSGFVAAAAACEPCGIDVETVRPVQPLPAALSVRERQWVDSQPDPAVAFLRLWVRKEALVKAGAGALDRLPELDALDPAGLVTDWTGDTAVGACALLG